MKLHAGLDKGRVLLILGLTLIGCLIGRYGARFSRGPAQSYQNPQDFVLRATGSTYSCWFRYDPRECDHWMFRSGGGQGSPLDSVPPTPTISTNLPEAR